MASKCMKRCSTSSAIREMQIKTSIRCHYTPIRMAKIKNRDNSKCWRGCKENGSLIHFSENVKWYSHSEKQLGSYLLYCLLQVTYYIIPLTNILEMRKLQKSRPDYWLPGVRKRMEVGEKWVWLQKDNMRNACVDGNTLYLDCISVSVVVVTLYYCFTRYYHWGRLGKGYTGPLHPISHNCI